MMHGAIIKVPVGGTPPANFGSECLVCSRGYELVKSLPLKWRHDGYVAIIAEGKPHSMHIYLVTNLVMLLSGGIPKGHVVHHINGNRCDNRLANLEVVSYATNAQARRKASNCSSKYIGVHKRGSKWYTHIMRNNVTHSLGTFASEHAAARAYDRAALAVHGPHAAVSGLLGRAETARVLSRRDAYMPRPPKPNARGDGNRKRLLEASADPEACCGPILRGSDGSTALLPLRGKCAAGRYTMVSDRGWRMAAMYSWQCHSIRGKEYVKGRVLLGEQGTWCTVLLHRFLMGCTPHDGRIIDHLDGDGLNNTDSNLRDTTASGNARNKSSKAGSSSEHKGVSWHKRKNKWIASISIGGRLKHLGLYLVDLFAGLMFSGDQDGNNGRTLDLAQALPGLIMHFAGDHRVSILQDRSDFFLAAIPDRCLDIVYIDADHSYEAVSRDLDLALRKVRSGGYVCGHDYEMNMSKACTYYDFGVRRAVDEFCALHGLEICAKGMDGCVSFCIRLP
ncbi:hypothetical protein OEZ85_011025 [Tetradesmus obliquus]|uniref:AP2/ERF domain-containing protein n=1 Tax=Tetradesmus obliquus TaxID=3088 RepID=A0ABY8TP10_TETOB|nr:hypothetical protein OEZ85_011025 [Tetradesmus obliquus]